jgi:hypothetical protein
VVVVAAMVVVAGAEEESCLEGHSLPCAAPMRSIRFINPKGHSAFIQTCDWLYIAVFLISFHYST